MRRLSLHASALSNPEYDLFTNSLKQIVDDDNPDNADDVHLEKLVVGIREARAWLRGRYSDVSVANIDGILKLFCPNLGASDTITGAEFFAALRLVIHVEGGKEIDRSLAFVQVDPISRSLSPSKVPNGTWSKPPSPSRNPSGTSPSGQTNHPSSSNPFTRHADPSHHSQPPIHPSHRSESSRTIVSVSQRSTQNPFFQNGPRSDDGTGTGKLPPLPPRKPSSIMLSQQSLSPLPPRPPPISGLSSSRIDRSISPTKRFGSTPPVPPKPAMHVTSTLMKQSLTASKVAQTMKKAEEQLEKERVMQVLKSSSVVSGTNIHNHQHGSGSKLPKSGKASAPASSEGSGSDGGIGRRMAPPLPKRRNTHQTVRPPSPPLSASSLEQVALATAPDYQHREREEHIPPVPPPMHPDRKQHQSAPGSSSTSTPGSTNTKRAKNLETFESIYGPMTSSPKVSPAPSADGSNVSKSAIVASNTGSTENDSPSARVFRSKSLNQTVKPLAPPVPPPLRKKRPESVQVLGSPTHVGGFLVPAGTPPKQKTSMVLGHRRSSLSMSSTPSSLTHASSGVQGGLSSASTGSTSSSGFGGNIQRTIDALHSFHGNLQPKLEKARYKAEAGLSRRGYVRGVGQVDRSSPTRFEQREEQEGLTLRDGSRTGRRLVKDRWREGYNDLDPDGRQVDGFDDLDEESFDRDDRWGGVQGLAVHAPSTASSSTLGYGLPKHRPRHVFDDSPERDDLI